MPMMQSTSAMMCIDDQRAFGAFSDGVIAIIITIMVLIGLIDADPTSYRRNSRDWRPHETFIELLAS